MGTTSGAENFETNSSPHTAALPSHVAGVARWSAVQKAHRKAGSSSARIASEVMSGPWASRFGEKAASAAESRAQRGPKRLRDHPYTSATTPAPTSAATARPLASMRRESFPSPNQKRWAIVHCADSRHARDPVEGRR